MASASSSGRPDLPAELNERGLRCKAAGRLTEARQCYERARDLLRLEEPVDYSALATVYHNLGINIGQAQIIDPSGRPQYLLDYREAIRELV